MNARRLERFEGLLNAERTRIQQTIERLRNEESADTELAAPGDEVAAGALGVAPDDDDALLLHSREELRAIDDALRLIHESPHDYGICAQCGRPIPDERLEVLPATRLCGRGA